MNTKVFQLTRTFRQKEKQFAEVLNNIRTGRNIVDSLKFINERCVTTEGLDDVFLTLTTRIADADQRNNDMLNKPKGHKKIKASTTIEHPSLSKSTLNRSGINLCETRL
jgi:hypothetical protein